MLQAAGRNSVKVEMTNGAHGVRFRFLSYAGFAHLIFFKTHFIFQFNFNFLKLSSISRASVFMFAFSFRAILTPQGGGSQFPEKEANFYRLSVCEVLYDPQMAT